MSVRLIDANKIFPWYLKAFSVEEVGEKGAIGPDEVRFSMNDIRENLDNIPTEPVWIPYSERLPEEDGEYIITRNLSNSYVNRDLGVHVEIVSFAQDLSSVNQFDFVDIKRPGWYDYDSEYGFYEIDGVIAWMPLPEPY